MTRMSIVRYSAVLAALFFSKGCLAQGQAPQEDEREPSTTPLERCKKNSPEIKPVPPARKKLAEGKPDNKSHPKLNEVPKTDRGNGAKFVCK